jgi:hypothetical protein
MRHRYGGRHHVLGLQRPRGAGDREQLAADLPSGRVPRVRWASACKLAACACRPVACSCSREVCRSSVRSCTDWIASRDRAVPLELELGALHVARAVIRRVIYASKLYALHLRMRSS